MALRRRTPWEAIDLGFVIARRWFGPLWRLWFVGALPVGLALFLLGGPESWWVGLGLWWCKPLYEPPLLFWMSRAVFADQTPLREVLRQWPRLVAPQLLANLTWRRFSPVRSFSMPVALLEGLSGRARRERLRLLGRNQHAATWLTFVGMHLETVLELGFFVGVYAMIPEELRWVDLDELFSAPGRIGEWLQLIGGLLCMSVIAPFYVAAGFALYLHRRGELEGWDIEIRFRRTARRLAGGEGRRAGAVLALLAAAGLSLGTLAPSPALADTADTVADAGQARLLIREVLEDDAFGRREEVGYWRYTGERERSDGEEDAHWLWRLIKGVLEYIGGFFKGYAAIGKLLMWALAVLLITYAAYRILSNRGWFGQGPGRGQRGRGRGRGRPAQLFGLELAPESLPDDPAAEARRLAQAGDARGALSLLYRAALSQLMHHNRVEIPDSATEGECLRLVEGRRGGAETAYFRELTGQWLRLAYAHRLPERERLLGLCERWREVFGHVPG
ncbi:MAG: hypothetical protein B0D88_08775 [Candidatus Sedimenticola endophacoides]|nr:MAG: hypothetical protein B0D88_08775 [Candidatus Sedimenticola endophacoides]